MSHPKILQQAAAEGSWDPTNDLPISGWPALPPESSRSMNSQSALHYNTYKSLVCCVWGQSGQCPSDYWCLPWYSDCFFYHIYAFCCILSSFSVLAFRLTVSHWLIGWMLLITWPCWWSRWWLWKQLKTVSASVRMFLLSFSWDCSVFGLYLTLHFLSLSVFPDVSVHTCVSFIHSCI